MAVPASPRPPDSSPPGSAEPIDRDELKAYGAVVLLAALASGVALASGTGDLESTRRTRCSTRAVPLG
jgi:hypothetical protein